MNTVGRLNKSEGSPALGTNKPESKDDSKAQLPPRNTWFVFALILLANYFVASLLFPGRENQVAIP